MVAKMKSSSQRILITFCDSEGSITRLNKYTHLWDVCIKLSCIYELTDKSLKYVQSSPGILNYSQSKNSSIDDIKKPLKSFATCIDYMIDYYKADKLVCICWSARHDEKALQQLTNLVNKEIQFIDGIHYFKNSYKETYGKSYPKDKKYGIDHMLSKYNFCRKQTHHAFQDVIDMSEIMSMIYVDHLHKGSITADKINDYIKENGDHQMIHRKIFSTDIFKDLINDVKPIVLPKKNIIKSKTIQYDLFQLNDLTYEIAKGWTIDNHYGKGLYLIEKGKRISVKGVNKQNILQRHYDIINDVVVDNIVEKLFKKIFS
jgi:hypothetical protein